MPPVGVAARVDFPSILLLIKELADFEKAPEKVTNTIEQMEKENDIAHGYFSETFDKEIVNVVFFFFLLYLGVNPYTWNIFLSDSATGAKY